MHQIMQMIEVTKVLDKGWCIPSSCKIGSASASFVRKHENPQKADKALSSESV